MSNEQPSSKRNLDYGERASVAAFQSAVSREKREPITGVEPVSLWSFIIAGLAIALGASYLGAFSGGYNLDSQFAMTGYAPEARPVVDGGDEKEDTRPWIDQWMDGGKRAYAMCAACHQPNGAGVQGQYPPLNGSEWVIGSTERLSMVIYCGLTGPIRVKGVTLTGQAMPPQGAAMTDKQVAQVMTYIRRSWGNDASIVTEEMAKAGRAKYGSRTAQFTQADLEAVPADAMLPGAEVDPQTGQPKQ